MTRVFTYNPDSFWLIEHLAPHSDTPRPIGFYAFLPLTEQGHAALKAETLDTADPPLAMLAPFGQVPAALYLWAILARKLAKTLDPLIARAMGLRYAGVPLYARVTTTAGLKSGVGAGSKSVSDDTQIAIGSLIRIPSPNRGGAPS